ncbi:MAG TPA: thioredoxin family protein [Thermoanaerobaculia bacterium]
MKKLFVISLVLLATAALADELAVGAKAPAFSLVNAVDGKTYAFKPADGKISVVFFTCNQCPYAKAFEPRLIAIARQYQAKGVAFYAIDPNDENRFAEETLANMKDRAVNKGYPYPYLKDADSSIARAYGARVTPHVYVIDQGGVLRYRGYVDDSARPEERTKTGLTDALDALLANRQVATTATHAFGCTIKWKG